MDSKSTLKEQFRRNLVAVISLAVAVTALGYNTWRNEASEHNRNQRLVAIQVLLMMGELQQITLDRQYGTNVDGATLLRAGWSKVLTTRDLAQLMDGSVSASATRLWQVWDEDHIHLGTDVKAKNRIIEALEDVRKDTHEVLTSLD
jgi:hypothetical protein